ncbi:helix-turn-helix domain-containing protein [Rubritalea tangerina]|uniref:Helix-turn-helix domain-containing protein n=2 Tax=Rubritalea tangerina TaxID=430798 RepID=A0ABW4ZAX6_9BACT
MADLRTTNVPTPTDYLRGVGDSLLGLPQNILFFRRTSKQVLQQESIKNRSHHRIVAVFNLETAAYIHLDHLEVELRPRQALVIPPHQFHHFSNLESPKLNWLFCTFELERPSYIEPLRNKVIPVNEAALESLSQALAAFLNEDGKPHATDELQALVLTTLVRLKQAAIDHSAPYNIITDDIVSKVNRVLIETPNTELTISTIADNFKLSESRMRAVFRDSAGVSLGKYILNYKIHTALSLLANTKLAVSEIADQAGFTSLQAFSRTFKEKTGVPPSHFRKKQ